MFTLQEEEFDSVYPLFARLVEEFEAGRKYKGNFYERYIGVYFYYHCAAICVCI